MSQPERKTPDDYWKSKSFARRYCINSVNGPMSNEGFREFDGLTFLAQAQGIQYLTQRPKSLLDVGCGPCVRGARLGHYFNIPVTGIDYSEAMLEQAKMLISKLPEDKKPTLIHGSAEDIPFDDNTFDVALSYGLLMSLPDITKAAAEIMRVVKYGFVAIEETDAVMDDVRKKSWDRVRTVQFPGRIYWHDYLRTFRTCSNIHFTPLYASASWDQGPPPAYARYIFVKGET